MSILKLDYEITLSGTLPSIVVRAATVETYGRGVDPTSTFKGTRFAASTLA